MADKTLSLESDGNVRQIVTVRFGGPSTDLFQSFECLIRGHRQSVGLSNAISRGGHHIACDRACFLKARRCHRVPEVLN
jgi:hypothetical protein